MPEFHYRASSIGGEVVQGAIEEESESAVVERLHERGLIPLQIQRQVVRFYALRALDFSTLLRRISGRDILTFTQQFTALLEAGLPIDRALSICARVTENPRLQSVVEAVLRDIESGKSVHEAMQRHPAVFSRLYINMVRAGAEGGVLELVLRRMTEFQESTQELRDYMVSAMVYPAILTMVAGISVVILLTYVLPKFTLIFSQMDKALPLSTRIILDMSYIVRHFWWMIIGAAALVILAWKAYVSTDEGRVRWDGLKLRIGFVRGMVQRIETARFARTLGTLLRSGVPILVAVRIVRETIGNQVIARSLEHVQNTVKEGGGLARPLMENGLFPPLAVHMITVGEETGRLDEMLLNVADNYDREVRNVIRRFTSLLEPMLILTMGMMVGFIVLSMLSAIFSIHEIPF
ncbi:MAG: type II secretion system F family protein [Deltaproteobacteria bacterium]|nr:type II secretion system F family protein [Deltaproteobacteria bacterium]MBW2307054.1 type II secretion system F family protein [Deltaproteobacteria bacterium]